MSNLQEALQMLKTRQASTSPQLVHINIPSISNVSPVKALAKEIKILRQKQKWSQRKVAQMAGISQATVYRLEHGWTRNIRTFIAVLETLGMKLTITTNK